MNKPIIVNERPLLEPWDYGTILHLHMTRSESNCSGERTDKQEPGVIYFAENQITFELLESDTLEKLARKLDTTVHFVRLALYQKKLLNNQWRILKE